MHSRPRILICARSPQDAGLVIPVLDNAGCEANFTCRQNDYKSGSFEQSRHIGLIVLGDDAASSDNKKVYGREMSWVFAAQESGKAVLGICHGAQLLAAIRGGGLKRWRSETDRGLTRLKLTEDGENDPVVRHVKGAQVAQWHSHTFGVPEGAVDLAHSTNEERPHCDAFRIGSNVYGLQFHPEPTAEMLVRDCWSRHSVPDKVRVAAEQTGQAVLRAWVEIAVSRDG